MKTEELFSEIQAKLKDLNKEQVEALKLKLDERFAYNERGCLDNAEYFCLKNKYYDTKEVQHFEGCWQDTIPVWYQWGTTSLEDFLSALNEPT